MCLTYTRNLLVMLIDIFARLIRNTQRLINHANVRISVTGKLYVNVLGHKNTLAKFQTKLLNF